MPISSDHSTNNLYDLIDQTGIEKTFGATPVPLPRLSAEALQSSAGVDTDLLQADPELKQTWQALTAPEAVVRVQRHGLETDPGAFWVFVHNGLLVQLSVGLQISGELRLTSLADSTALFNEIERLLAMPSMPKKAYARAVLNRGDAEDIYDQSQGTGFNVAAELLESDGLTDEEAQVAFDVMRTASVAGRISFLSVYDGRVTLAHGIAIGKSGADIWMASATPYQSKNLVLETVMAGAFHRSLVEGWSSLDLD